MPPPVCNPDFRPFDLETGVRVAPKLGNLPSKFWHARPLGYRIIRYVRDGRTDRRTDGQKQRLLSLSLQSGHNNITRRVSAGTVTRHVSYRTVVLIIYYCFDT